MQKFLKLPELKFLIPEFRNETKSHPEEIKKSAPINDTDLTV